MLSHTADLISLSTWRVKIINLGKCINLRNLYSWLNVYKSNDIVPLINLHRIFSNGDKYLESGICLLHDLFKGKKLEYVLAVTYLSDSAVANPIIIPGNI